MTWLFRTLSWLVLPTSAAVWPLVPPPMRASALPSLPFALPGAAVVPTAAFLVGAPAALGGTSIVQSACVASTATLRLQLVITIPLAGAGSMRTPPTAPRPS